MVNIDRLVERLETLSRSGLDLVSLWRGGAPMIAEAVPHFEAPCFFTVDPASQLTTSHFQEGLPHIPAEWLGREYAEGDYNSMTEVLASPEGVGTLHDATNGHPELSKKFHEEMKPYGCEQELLIALRTRDRESWGAVGLYREVGRPQFDEREIGFMRSVAPALAEGARRGLLMGQASEPDLPDAPGVVVFDEHLNVESLTPTAASWLEELGGSAESPPASVLAAAGRALDPEGRSAEARVLSIHSRWLVVHGASLPGSSGSRRATVIVQPAQPSHLAPLLMQAHGLTRREQQVTQVVLGGASTTGVARELSIAEDTVQQHLKSIFDKTGVRSRRELVSLLFQTHYEPRVRDNEHRTLKGRPARDGPLGG